MLLGGHIVLIMDVHCIPIINIILNLRGSYTIVQTLIEECQVIIVLVCPK